MARRTGGELERIGREVAMARDAGVAWKVLCDHYGMGRTRLWMLEQAARQAKSTAGAITFDVHEHLGVRPRRTVRDRPELKLVASR